MCLKCLLLFARCQPHVWHRLVSIIKQNISSLDGGVLRDISSMYLNIVDQCLEVPLYFTLSIPAMVTLKFSYRL